MRINLKILSTILALLLLATIAKSQPTGVDPNVRDTISISSITTFSASNGFVPVYFYNDQPLSGIEVTLTYSSTDVMIDSFSFVGGRLENNSFKDADQITNNSLTIYSYGMADGLIPTGNGLLGYLYLSFIPGISPQAVTIDTMSITISEREYSTAFSDENANAFSPYVQSGTLTIQSGGCCLGDRGNINSSPDDNVDISDLVYFVDFMFTGGPDPVCWDEANVNGSVDDAIDISDLVYFVDFMFTGGPPLASCP